MKYEIEFIDARTIRYKKFIVKVRGDMNVVYESINGSSISAFPTLLGALEFIDLYIKKNINVKIVKEMMSHDNSRIFRNDNPEALIGKSFETMVESNNSPNVSFSNLYWTNKKNIKAYISQIMIYTRHPLYNFHEENETMRKLFTVIFENDIVVATEIHYSVDDALAFINSHPGL